MARAGVLKKRPQVEAGEARALMECMSKAAIFDMAAGMAALGTDESPEQTATRLCREAALIAELRGDRKLPAWVYACAARRIDSDPPE